MAAIGDEKSDVLLSVSSQDDSKSVSELHSSFFRMTVWLSQSYHWDHLQVLQDNQLSISLLSMGLHDYIFII